MAISRAKGTILKIGDGAMSEAFTAILNVTDQKWDGVSWDTESTTSNDSATPVKTFKTTLYSNGSIKLVIDYDPNMANHVKLRSLSTSGADCNFQVIYENSIESKQFVGSVQAFGFDTSVSGLNKANVSIMINGAFSEIS